MVILVCVFNEEFLVLSVDSCDSLSSIVNRISNRWVELKDCSVKVSYSVESGRHCLLTCDDDVSCMIRLADALHQNHLDAIVSIDGAVGSSSSYVGNALVSDEYEVRGYEVVEYSSSSSSESRRINLGWDSVVLKSGQGFRGGAVEFRESLEKLAIETGFPFKYDKNDARRIKAVCALKDELNCEWMVRASLCRSNSYFYVHEVCNVHSCGTSSRFTGVSRISANLVGKQIIGTVRDKPSTLPSDVEHMFASQFSMPITYAVAKNAVKRAREAVFGGVVEAFNCLPAYVRAIRNTNPGSLVVLDVDPATSRFKRIFIAYDACIRGFSFCRSLLYLDGCHLKCNTKGHLLAATGKDGNNGLYPLCYAVVESEDYDNWLWFLQNLRLILQPPRKMTFMTDRNIGLLDALPQVFPDDAHSYCIYHLAGNLKNHFSGRRASKDVRDMLVDLLCNCAYASTVQDFQTNMDALLLKGGTAAVSFFDGLDPAKWANAFFTGDRYGNMASTAAESFNAWVLTERYLPVFSMIDAIRVKIMKQVSDRRTLCLKWNSLICPKVDAKLYQIMDIGRKFRVVSSSRFEFEVFSSPRVAVNLKDCTCTCTEWQRFGFPCAHVAAVVISTKSLLAEFVDRGYLRDSFSRSYQFAIHPIPESYKSDQQASDIQVVPSIGKRQPGRPRKKRFKSRFENRRPIICGRCKKLGHHNALTCNQPLVF